MSKENHVLLTFTDVAKNNNKFWEGWIEGGVFHYRYGKQEAYKGETVTPAKTNTKAGGPNMLDKTVAAKVKKGYKRVDLEGYSGGTPGAGTSDVGRAAKSQIDGIDDPVVKDLVETIVDQNIHAIGSASGVTYNPVSGQLETALGLVTGDTVTEALAVLDKIEKNIGGTDAARIKLANQYFELIPTALGYSRPDIDDLFGTVEHVDAKRDLCDKLMGAIDLSKTLDTDDEQDDQRLFNLAIEPADQQDVVRISKWFDQTNKAMHHYTKVRVDKVFAVSSVDFSEYMHTVDNQQQVWHGSTVENLLSIMTTGLNVAPPSTARIAGKMWGHGIYGALDSSKSMGYSFGRWGGSRNARAWLFVCDFAMGSYQEPAHSTQEPSSGYDTIWARASKTGLRNDELIVYDNNRCRLRYLVMTTPQ